MILAVAALPNGAVAARPLHGGGGHVQAAWGPVAAAPPAAAMMPKSLASSGRSSCTNDPKSPTRWSLVAHVCITSSSRYVTYIEKTEIPLHRRGSFFFI